MDFTFRRLTQGMASAQTHQPGAKQGTDASDKRLPPQRIVLLRMLSQTLHRHRASLHPEKSLFLLEKMLAQLEHTFNHVIDPDVLAGLLLHLACSQGQQRKEKSERISIYLEQQFARELALCRQAIRATNRALVPELPEEEAYTLVDILCQVDIPLAGPRA